MKRREFITLVGGAAVWPCAVWAQQTGKLPSIAFLAPDASTTSAPALPAFIDGLRQLGWIENKTVTIEYRYADNRPDRLAELAAELVRRKVDVIVARGTLGPLAAKQATTTIPIVMTASGDPVGTGLVASLAHPGGNVTGLSLMAPDLGGKRLELLKEIVPELARVAIIWNAANPYPALVFKETENAAQRLKIELQSCEVRMPNDVGSALEAAVRGKANALIVVEDPLVVNQRKPIADFAAKNRLPAIGDLREFVDAGGLISYGAHLPDLYRRAAAFGTKRTFQRPQSMSAFGGKADIGSVSRKLM